jgi:hypothetical protein
MELMRDPIVDDFGHTYEWRALKRALIYNPGVSPKTRQRFPNGEPRLQTNYTVKAMVDEYSESQCGGGGGEILAEEIVEEELSRPAEPVKVFVAQPSKGKSIESSSGASAGSSYSKPEAEKKPASIRVHPLPREEPPAPPPVTQFVVPPPDYQQSEKKRRLVGREGTSGGSLSA